jgi:hypothetical protein
LRTRREAQIPPWRMLLTGACRIDFKRKMAMSAGLRIATPQILANLPSGVKDLRPISVPKPPQTVVKSRRQRPHTVPAPQQA